MIADDANKSIFLFGGYDGQARSNDLWKFGIETKRWTCLQESTSLSSVDGGNNDASLESSSNVSNQVSADANVSANNEDLSPIGVCGWVPSRHFGCISVAQEGHFILWGGFDGSRWLNNMYVYTFATCNVQLERNAMLGLSAAILSFMRNP